MLTQQIALSQDDPIVELYYYLMRIDYALEVEGPESVHLVYKTSKKDYANFLRILCLDAGFWLKKKFMQFYNTIFLSATLVPPIYYKKLFNLEQLTINVYPSPFPSENRRVLIVDSISTNYSNRKQSVNDLISIFNFIANNTSKKVLIFFASYDYLFLVYNSIKAKYGSILTRKIKIADRNLQPQDFAQFISELKRSKNKKLIFTALGSSLGESIEFPSNFLSGICVVGPGYPTFDFELRLLHSYYENQSLDGDKYSIVFPAVSRVTQALGRLIRSESDRGFILLIGNQFITNSFYRFLPRYLYSHVEDLIATRSWQEAIKDFF